MNDGHKRRMKSAPQSPDPIAPALAEVQELMAQALASTPLRFLVNEYKGLTGNGKMLRARLGFRVGPAAGTAHRTLLHAAAAVEMIHAASLLHDDVIDGGYLRRGSPTFWVERGVPGAILLGDLLLFKALDLICSVENGRLTHSLVRLTGQVCEAETEQELVLRGATPNWDRCVSVARRKTGALFAFMAAACGGPDETLSRTLLECGYKVGTAYQLADDILDATGDAEAAGKSLGTDQARAKMTAVTALQTDNVDPIAYIERLCDSAEQDLAAWPAIRPAWEQYMADDLRPAVNKNLACYSR
jgi:octaprenyl-diphosphate synthase